MTLKALFKSLKKEGIDTDRMWSSIIGVVLRSLFCLSSHPTIKPEPNAFEIYGYDIMFDADYRAWLVEVNASPAVSCDSEADVKVKIPMLTLTLTLALIGNEGQDPDANPNPNPSPNWT